jgi:hypothetical protein
VYPLPSGTSWRYLHVTKWVTCKSFASGFQGCVALSQSTAMHILASNKVMKGSCDFREGLDELLIEVTGADEFPYSSYNPMRLPVLYCFDLYLFHFKSLQGYVHSILSTWNSHFLALANSPAFQKHVRIS